MTDEINNANPTEQEEQAGSGSHETEKANQKLFTQDEVNEIIRKRLAKVKEKETRHLLTDPDQDETAAKLADLSAQVDNYRIRAEKAEAALNEIHVREEKKALCEEYSLHPSLVSFLTGETARERREQAESLASATRPKYPRLDTRDMSVMGSLSDFGKPHKPKGFYQD